jgi:hypothetical protein
MNTQAIQQTFDWFSGPQELAPVTSTINQPLASPWDERSNEPHPEYIGLRVLSCVNLHKGMK